MASSATDDDSRIIAINGSTFDVGKINDLAANLDRRLTGGLHGEFIELGSKYDADIRHNQLEMIFGLREELATFNSNVDKLSKQAASDSAAKGKKGMPINTNMIATMKAIAQEQLVAPMRDMAVTNERLQHRVQKLEDENEGHKAKIKAQDIKIRKLNGRNQEHSNIPADLVVRLQQIRDDLYDVQNKLEGPDGTVEWALTAISCLQSELRDEVKRIKRRREIDQNQEALHHEVMKERVESIENRLWRAGIPR